MFVRVQFLVLCGCLLYGISVIVAAEEETEIETLSLRYLAADVWNNLERSSRVTGGTKADYAQFPYIIVIVLKQTGSLCTGSLISPRFILSVAHCIENVTSPKSISVVAGVIQPLANISDPAPGYQVRRSVDMFLHHPRYKAGSFADDISLISIRTRPFNVTDYVAPIAMAKGPFPKRGELCRAIGWGKSSALDKNVLRWTSLWVLTPNFDCSRPGDSPEGLLCGKVEPGNLLSDGDSGGPLVCQGVLTGVIRILPNTSAIDIMESNYVHVAKYFDWIKKYVSDMLPPVELNAASHSQVERGFWSNRDRASRFVAGTKALDTQFPYVVLIVLTNQGRVCGGVIISPRFILSVAHCIVDTTSPKRINVFAGLTQPSNKYTDGKPPGMQVRCGVDMFKHHPGYKKGGVADDISLISIRTQPFDMTTYVAPIPMAQGFFPTRGELCRAVGWGKSGSKTRLLKWTFLWVVTPDIDCSYPKDPGAQVLCGRGEHGSQLNSGDGGGALVCQGVLTGLIKGLAEPSENPVSASIHVHVAMYLDWINIYVSDILPPVELTSASHNQDWSWRLLMECLAVGLCVSW